MPDQLDPKINLGEVGAGLAKLIHIVNLLSEPAELAKLEADGKLAKDDVQNALADAKAATAALEQLFADLQHLLEA